MKKSILIFYWLTFLNFAFGQNLIPNSSFEIAKPDTTTKLNWGNNFTCENWTTPNGGTPDYYTAKRSGDFGVTNRLGTQKPKSGNAYAGIVLNEWITDVPPKSGESVKLNSEFLQIKLNKKLVQNNYYCLSLNISLAENSRFASNELDFSLNKEKITQRYTTPIKSNNYKRIISTSYFSDKINWMPICSYFKAAGDEEYLIIGIFSNKCKVLDLTTKYLAGVTPTSYYYIDELSLTKINDTLTCLCKIINPFDSASTKAIILNNINFEPGKEKLISSSYNELNSLIIYLKTNSNYKIEIAGHTDNAGQEINNLKLSEARAKTVADYLIENGINKNRISYKGYGSTKPLKSNDNPKDRLANRRVEFKITK